MDTKNDKKDFSKWLETLQQESWQLELIISGFAIFLLIGVYEPINASYYDQHDSSLAELCPNLKPGWSGLTLDFYIGKNENPRIKLDADSTLTCFSSLHQIFIDDSLKTDISYRFYNHPQRKQEGLVTILDVGNLPRGEHQISIKSKNRHYWQTNDSLFFKQQEIIPFWKE